MNQAFDPDEIFLDARNLPAFNRQQFEGQMEKPIGKKVFFWLTSFMVLGALIFLGRTIDLQVRRGEALAARSENNTLRHIPIFAERGLIVDRLGVELTWNDPGRRYLPAAGLAHLLGYLGRLNQTELATGQYHPEELIGREGVERFYNQRLRGVNGVKIEEIDAAGRRHSQYLLTAPASGQSLTLSIDSRLQTKMYEALAAPVEQGLFVGAAGVMMDIYTGEILALVSAPEYDPNILAAGADQVAIQNYLADKRHPFLNRATAGRYTPGSIIKPFIALAALTENIISPEKEILSTGALTLPNPFDSTRPSIFKDWRAHGLVNLRRALAVSSNVYFYTVGGGFQDQTGLGISRIAKYATKFGFGQSTGLDWPNEEIGLVPTPAWKEKVSPGDPWRLGDTYQMAIGQYGFQVTPLQVVRAVAAIANGGQLVEPTILAKEEGQTAKVKLIEGPAPAHWQIVREGLRLAVTEGTAIALNTPAAAIAAKTGTAELGNKDEVNSWVIGFFPYERPHYAFVVVLERRQGPALFGAIAAFRQVIDWLASNAPEYLAG